VCAARIELLTVHRCAGEKLPVKVRRGFRPSAPRSLLFHLDHVLRGHASAVHLDLRELGVDLVAFLAVAEERSFTRAAAKLSVS